MIPAIPGYIFPAILGYIISGYIAKRSKSSISRNTFAPIFRVVLNIIHDSQKIEASEVFISRNG